MGNLGYLQNPSFVEFPQAGSIPDPYRMQRPFAPQAQESKDIDAGSREFGLRLMENYPGLRGRLQHLPQFLHPGVQFGGSFPSAFAPPPQLEALKMEEDTFQSNSSAGASYSPPARLKEEETGQDSGDGERCTPPDEGRYRRKKKASETCCPACGITVRAPDLDSHFMQELERLYKLNNPGRARRNNRDTPSDGSTEGGWETYQRIKENRQSRLRVKNRKRKPDDVQCPVCNEAVNGTAEQLNGHVEQCLRKHGQQEDDEDETVDVEAEGDVYEEYEWAGQRRIRAASLLVGGYAGAGMSVCRSAEAEDDDRELVVDGDDTAAFGPAQYAEADVVVPSAEGPGQERERRALRDAVISPGGSRAAVVEEERDAAEGREDSAEAEVPPTARVVEALKSRIRLLEADHKVSADRKFVCLICMEHYTKPLASIRCWHVHCEQCWLHTLGAKKLCPQCNLITSPSDLRRLYL